MPDPLRSRSVKGGLFPQADTDEDLLSGPPGRPASECSWQAGSGNVRRGRQAAPPERSLRRCCRISARLNSTG